jgi:hypothetical protein
MNASGRPNTCKSNGKFSSEDTSGARVSNAYAIYLYQGDTHGKLWIIPHTILEWHHMRIKATADRDERASD